MAKKPIERKQPRNAKDGRFASPQYAERRPDTTVVDNLVSAAAQEAQEEPIHGSREGGTETALTAARQKLTGRNQMAHNYKIATSRARRIALIVAAVVVGLVIAFRLVNEYVLN